MRSLLFFRLKGDALTIPTYITLFRMALVPVFCVLIYQYDPSAPQMRLAALGIYAVAAVSDLADGYIARHYHQRSRLGTRLDPLADKLMINLGFVFVAANPNFEPGLPLWFPPLILFRDIVLVLWAMMMVRRYGGVQIQPKTLGKWATALNMVTLITVLVDLPVATLFM